MTDRERLRDELAKAALQGMLAYSHVNPATGNYHENCDQLSAALAAYGYADAMLVARQIQSSYSTPNGVAKGVANG